MRDRRTPGVVDGSRCISYFTIELKEAIPQHFRRQWDNWAFGCDICQEVCPWNRFATASAEAEFVGKEELFALNKGEWADITEEVFEKIFAGTPVKRAGYKKFLDNLNVKTGDTPN